MKRISKTAIAAVIVALSLAVRSETTPGAENAMPPFALAKLSIAKMGVFLDQNGAFANQIVPNAGPLAKVFLANILFKLPVDESLNFEGPAQIYFLAPLSFNATQETAMVLPVSDAEKLKKNIISVYGEPVDHEGAMVFAVPQPLPDPDKTLMVKVANGKALLAPSVAVLAQLETAVAAAAGPVAGSSDAAFILSLPAIKKVYGSKIEEALQAGAFLASESVDGLKKVSDQLDGIIKTLWQIDMIELRASFDKDSKNASVELAITPLKETKLAAIFNNPPPGLDGNNSTLLATGGPVNTALRLNGDAVHHFYKQYAPPNQAALDNLVRSLLSIFDGETVLSFDPARMVLLHAQRVADDAAAAKKADALQQTLSGISTLAVADIEALPKDTVYSTVTETIQHRNTQITLRKFAVAKGAAKPVVQDSTGYFADASKPGLWLAGAGLKPEEAIKGLLDNAAGNPPVSAEQKAVFDAPAPGTLAFVSIKLLAILRTAAGEFLPENVAPEQLVGGLSDAPISISVSMHGGSAALRVTLPGATAGSLYAVSGRLKRNGINVADMLGLNGRKNGAENKVPGNIPAPPPEK